MKKQGRPRGLTINRTAVEDRLLDLGLKKSDLCESTGVSSGNLADLLHRGKGTSRDTVELLAAALRCRPATIAPEWSASFVAVRPADRSCLLPVSAWLASVAPAPDEEAIPA